MKLFEDDEITNEGLSEERIYKYSMPIINLYRQVTYEYPEQYHRLELYPIDMTKELLTFMVYYRGPDGRLARNFTEVYLDRNYTLTEEKAVRRMGEDKFKEMIEKLYELAIR